LFRAVSSRTRDHRTLRLHLGVIAKRRRAGKAAYHNRRQKA
jgi:hypothetical protein